MTQEALKLALDAFEQIFESTPPYRDDGTCVINDKSVELSNKAIAAIKEALAQTQEPVAVYGYCPECGAKGVMRERRPNGNDKCANGHTYPSSKSTPPQPEQEPVACERCKQLEEQAYDLLGQLKVANLKLSVRSQRTWAGLTDDEIDAIYTGVRAVHREIDSDVFARAIEAKLKEKNT